MSATIPDERAIFNIARRLDTAEARGEYLEQVCGANTELRKRVKQLLKAYDDGTGMLQPLAGELAVTLSIPSDKQLIGTGIGPYKIREQLAEGGMGVVFVAEQTEPVQRKVALKLVKPGLATREVLARFEAERQALALMDHPNVAKVLDAGTTDWGQPYFVMELVQGVAITEFCDTQKLPTEKRLKLLCDVCRAVQHAHQRGIIHRDLKPANILVAEIDGQPVAKVIDFGVAKAISGRVVDQTIYTQFSQMVGTPLYMSPEQAALGVIDVDTRSDVYSLGVVLYELLTGSTPFSREQLKQVELDEIRRLIREVDPQRPSALISTLKAEVLSTTAERRTCDPRNLEHSLRGELDWIVMKALEKDRNRRYESASALAADLQRHLNQEPVQAGPPTFAYRARKYVQRNRKTLSTAALALFIVAGAAGLTIRNAMRTSASRRVTVAAVNGLLGSAQAAVADNDVEKASKYIAEAQGRLASGASVDSELSDAVEAMAAEVAQRTATRLRFDDFASKSKRAMDAMSFSEDGGVADVPALDALKLYRVLDDPQWHAELSSSYLSDDEQATVRQLAYETLVSLADYGVRWKNLQSEERAEKSLEYLRSTEAFHPPTRAFYWVRSECYRILGDEEQATLDGEAFQTAEAQAAFDYFLPGHIDGWQGDLEKAIEAYRMALLIQPDHFNSLYFLANRLGLLARFEESEFAFRACLALRPDHVPSMQGLSRGFKMQKRVNDALFMQKRALEKATPDMAATSYLAIAQQDFETGDRQSAIRNADAALSLGRVTGDARTNMDALRLKAITAEADGNSSQALEFFEEMMKFVDEDSGLHRGWAISDFVLFLKTCQDESLRDRDRAVELAERAAAVVADAPEAYDVNRRVFLSQLAAARADSNDFWGAKNAYEEILQKYPNDLVSLINAARLFSESNDDSILDLERALELAVRAVEQTPSQNNRWDDEAFFRFYRIAEILSTDFVAVKKAWDHLLAHSREKSSDYVDDYLICYALFLCGCPDEALREPKLAKTLAIEATQRFGNGWLALGWAEYRLGEFQATIEHCRKSLNKKNDGNEVCNYFLLAMSYYQLGNAAEAEQWSAKASEWLNNNATFRYIDELKKEADELMDRK